MKAIQSIPSAYQVIYAVNLQKNKKTALFVNGLALLIAGAMVIPMHFFVPISWLFDMENGIIRYFLRFLVLLLSLIAYMVCHELIHGMTMMAFGTKKVKYGFTGLYAFAGSEDYYDKKSYIIIALAPVVIFAVLFGIINFLVPYDWFWVIYMLQVCNISGAAGDFFVTVKFAKMPKDILVKDVGVGMTVYAKQQIQ